MPQQPYNEDTRSVNEKDQEPPSIVMHAMEEQRRTILARMDLITTEDALFALGCSKATLAKYRSAGLKQLGEGRQRFYRMSQVAEVLEALAGESTDGEEETR